MARSFNGTTDLIAMDAAASYAVNVVYGLSAWVKAAASVAEACFYSEGRSSSNSGFLEVYNQSGSTGKCGLRMASGTATIVTTASTATVFDNTWHHVAVTQSAPVAGSCNWILYIDGTSDHSGTHVTTNVVTMNRATVGTFRRTTNTLFYAGTVAEVAKWSRLLAASEVAALASGLPAPHLYPDHYWPLWGTDSPELDIGGATHVGGTLTGTTAVAGARVSANLLHL